MAAILFCPVGAFAAPAWAGAHAHGLGLVVPTASTPSRHTLRAAPATSAPPPASVDLTPYAMTPGDQGNLGSCAAWATDYTALGYWENRQSIAGGGLAPMYTYAQIVQGQDVGSSIEDNANIAAQQGVDSGQDYTQGPYDYTTQPTASERANAVNWKLTNYVRLPISWSTIGSAQQWIESQLASGNPVVIGIPVYDNFYYVNSTNGGFYSGAGGPYQGDHAVTALGYDSTGLRIENSWGTSWGDHGFATLSWQFITSQIEDAVAVGPLVSSAPVSTGAPAISGVLRQGETLAASAGTWSPGGSSYSYQWEVSTDGGSGWAPVTGATASSYALAAGDLGNRFRVTVTATNSVGHTSATSAAVGPALSGAPANITIPVLSGTGTEGTPLTALTGIWSPAGTAYASQWQRSSDAGASWSSIPGATSLTYLPGPGDLGALLRILITASNAFGQASTASPAIGPIVSAAEVSTATTAAVTPVSPPAPANVSRPSVRGRARQGQTLQATSGGWYPARPALTYQWQRSRDRGASWSTVPRATGASYRLGTSDVGTRLRVIVVAANASGSAHAASSSTATVTGTSHRRRANAPRHVRRGAHRLSGGIPRRA